MREEDIAKALKACGGYTCNGCPMGRQRNCREILAKETLQMMGEWKAELERLRVKTSENVLGKVDRFARALADKNKKYAAAEENPLVKAEFRGIQMGAFLVVRYIAGLEKEG